MFAAERCFEQPNDTVHLCQSAKLPSWRQLLAENEQAMESIVERIAVVDEDGLGLFVEKRTFHVSHSKSCRMHNMVMYHLSTGELTNLIGSTGFIVAATGMRLSVLN